VPELGLTPDVAAYTTVMSSFFKEGEVGKKCNLFHEMMHRGVATNAVTHQ
jgi:pentatricopeptide repeat protein